MINPVVKNFRLSKLTPSHVAVANVVTSSSQTLAQLVAALGIPVDDVEKRVSILVDEGLAVRTPGGRANASYLLT